MTRDGAITDAEFMDLNDAFRHCSGLLRGDEAALRLQHRGGGGHAELARWIVGRKVISFAWDHDFWLPTFQFNLQAMSVKPEIVLVMAELGDVMEGLAIAQWFVQPHSDLRGQSPLAAMEQHGPDVFQAARLQRYLLKA